MYYFRVVKGGVGYFWGGKGQFVIPEEALEMTRNSFCEIDETFFPLTDGKRWVRIFCGW